MKKLKCKHEILYLDGKEFCTSTLHCKICHEEIKPKKPCYFILKYRREGETEQMEMEIWDKFSQYFKKNSG